MSKKILIVIAVLLLGGYYFLDSRYVLTPKTEIQTQPPRVLQERNSSEEVYIGEVNTGETAGSTQESGILDFNEVYRFDTIEEIGAIRFTMTFGKAYKMDSREFSYRGIGHQGGETGALIWINDLSDPEINKGPQPAWLVQVGGTFPLGYYENRTYWVTVLEHKSLVLKLRVEEISVRPPPWG